MTADDKFETSTEFGQKIALYRGLRFNCRISEDYTLQTQLSLFLEKLFFMDVANHTPI